MHMYYSLKGCFNKLVISHLFYFMTNLIIINCLVWTNLNSTNV